MKELTVDEYYDKWQEIVDQITTERNISKITVVRHAERELRNGKSACSREGMASCMPILEEARLKMVGKYTLLG